MKTSKEITINKKNKFGAEILCIGSEILLGNIVNTNSQWIAEQLAILGIPHFRQTVIGDNPARLEEAILEASNRSEILITTGGLGPTPDDITTKVIADTFKTPLEQRNDILIDLRNKSKDKDSKLSESQKKQSLVPKGAKIINNYSGTAPGIYWSPKKNFTILTFPGVPSELKEMWAKEASKLLISHNLSKEVISSKVLHFAGISESLLADKIPHLLISKNPTVATYATTGSVKVRITAKGENSEETNRLIEPIKKDLTQITGLKCFGVDNETLEEIVFKLLLKRKETIAVAESCTGGGIGSKLTKIPGSSQIFHGGVIAYNNSIKQSLLGVSRELIHSDGAVSDPVAIAMAKGARQSFGASWGLGITGIAGPEGGTKSKPVGLVHFALIGPKQAKSYAEKFNSLKPRINIQQLSVVSSLNQLRLLLLVRS